MSMTVEDFLEHYGVKGMKWGVRKQRKASKIAAKSGKTAFTDHPKHLTDDELKTRIARMELEKKYTELSSGKGQQQQTKGAKILDEVLTNSGKNVATTVATGAGMLAVNHILSKKLGPEKAALITKTALPKKK